MDNVTNIYITEKNKKYILSVVFFLENKPTYPGLPCMDTTNY